MIPRAKSLSVVDLAAVKYLSGAKNLSAVKYFSGVKNLSAVTHISEIVPIMPSDAETAAQADAAKKRLTEQHSASLDVLMADAVGRDLIQQRFDQLASATPASGGASNVPAPGPSGQVDSTAVLKDLVKVLVDAKAKKPKRKKAAKGKGKASKRTKSGNTTTDTSSTSDSEDGGREDPIPQPLQRPYGKGSYDRETDDLFTQDGELSLKNFKS